jgi:hypothetical protein
MSSDATSSLASSSLRGLVSYRGAESSLLQAGCCERLGIGQLAYRRFATANAGSGGRLVDIRCNLAWDISLPSPASSID